MKIRLLCLMPILLSAGCVLETAQPLSDPSTAKPDELMYGRWFVKGDRKISRDDMYLYIGKHTTNGNPQSIMEYAAVA